MKKSKVRIVPNSTSWNRMLELSAKSLFVTGEEATKDEDIEFIGLFQEFWERGLLPKELEALDWQCCPLCLEEVKHSIHTEFCAERVDPIDEVDDFLH